MGRVSNVSIKSRFKQFVILIVAILLGTLISQAVSGII
jgi:hypothetical protein